MIYFVRGALNGPVVLAGLPIVILGGGVLHGPSGAGQVSGHQQHGEADTKITCITCKLTDLNTFNLSFCERECMDLVLQL